MILIWQHLRMRRQIRKGRIKASRPFKAVKSFMEDERGAGAIEVAVIIVILIALAILFSEQIESVLQAIISKITEKVNSI